MAVFCCRRGAANRPRSASCAFIRATAVGFKMLARAARQGLAHRAAFCSGTGKADTFTSGVEPRMRALGRSLTHGVDALRHASEHLDLGVADRAVQALLECRGRRYFTGIGKSGHAAARMASSLSSIGLAAHWVHGAEWSHGELGALGAGDLIFAVSQSGRCAVSPRHLDPI